jgi:hypothetical protein
MISIYIHIRIILQIIIIIIISGIIIYNIINTKKKTKQDIIVFSINNYLHAKNILIFLKYETNRMTLIEVYSNKMFMSIFFGRK